MPWYGPYQIAQLLTHTVGEGAWLPPDNGTVYVVTRTDQRVQQINPLPNVLYVGGITAQNRFRIRVGDLIADMLGFFSENLPTRHCAGPKVRCWCQLHGVNPSELYLWWKTEGCPRCEEIIAFDELHPKLNKKRPNRCDLDGRQAVWHPDDC